MNLRAVLLGVIGVGLGLFCTEWVSHRWLGEAVPWFIAPMGASAVLLFWLPASPLAQPWPVIAGNVVSALIGVALHHSLGGSGLSAALAGALALGTMHVLRCVHPPGGAVALTAVLGGPALHALGSTYALWPVGLNSVLMVLLALLFHRASGRRYPHTATTSPPPHGTTDPQPSQRLGIQAEDIEVARASLGEWVDIDREDLEKIVTTAYAQAQRRHWESVRCEDIMSRDVISVQADETVEVAWARLAHHKVKALPVTDPQHRLVGIVSLHDVFLGPAGRIHPTTVFVQPVGQIMSTQVRTAAPQQPIADLVPAFSDGGLHHMPVIGPDRTVLGMVTQSDLVAALFLTRP